MLKDDTGKLVSEFCVVGEISKCMPGKKDFASVKEKKNSSQAKVGTSIQCE
jgi:hypothetical protein